MVNDFIRYIFYLILIFFGETVLNIDMHRNQRRCRGARTVFLPCDESVRNLKKFYYSFEPCSPVVKTKTVVVFSDQHI